MRIALQARLPAEDAAQRVLYASDQGAGTLGDISLGAAIYPGGHFRSEACVARRLAWLDRRPRNPGLQEFLRHENAFAPLAPEQRANLEAAGSGNAVFVLTGQQPGLLGGPILWYYKALTCAALARDWTARSGRPVIPVFWVAGDDSDLAECNHVELLDQGAAEIRGDLRLAFPDADRPLAMGERRVDPGELAALLKRLKAIWDAETVASLGRAYPAPSTLASGFLRLAHTLLGREGVLFVDGYSRNLRALARPVLDQAVDRWEEWQAALAAGTSAAALAGVPIQVDARPGLAHAFALRGGERHRLFAQRTADGDRVYTQDRPNRDARSDRSSLELSHDVFSRPLAADAIFPVLGHVLGPAELRYFAQLSPLFLFATGDMPLLHPRMTAAIAPAAAWDAFRGEGLDLSEALRYGPGALRARLADKTWRDHPAAAALSPAPADRWLEALRKTHERHFRDAGPLHRLEKSLGAAWKRYLRGLEKAAYAPTARGRQALFDHLRWLGNGMGQDRHLCLGSLLHAIGRDGLAEMRNVIDPLSTELQVLKYEDPKK
jgi:hypothetical protein